MNRYLIKKGWYGRRFLTRLSDKGCDLRAVSCLDRDGKVRRIVGRRPVLGRVFEYERLTDGKWFKSDVKEFLPERDNMVFHIRRRIARTDIFIDARGWV